MQEMLVSVFLLILGFILLIKGADFFVEGSSAVARRLQVPSLIIGMTIVAMGTSLPECAVSVTASLSGNNALAVGNVVGSNMFNLLIVCGVCALFCPLQVDADTLKKEFPFSIVCTILLVVLGYIGSELGHIDGLIFLLIFIIYLLAMIRKALKAKRKAPEEKTETISMPRCLVYIVGGAAAIKFGGDFVVDAASAIAAGFGISQTIIGLTIVALGTSLPELVTSIVAARKNEVDMAVGNVIGSNIFNILLVLGVAAAISPVTLAFENLIDSGILILVSVISIIFCRSKNSLERKEGMAMIAMYAAFFVYICVR